MIDIITCANMVDDNNMCVLITTLQDTNTGLVSKPTDLSRYTNEDTPVKTVISTLIANTIAALYPSQRASIRDVSPDKLVDIDIIAPILTEKGFDVYDGPLSKLDKISNNTKINLQQQCIHRIQFKTKLTNINAMQQVQQSINDLVTRVEYLEQQRNQLWAVVYELQNSNDDVQSIKRRINQLMKLLNE